MDKSSGNCEYGLVKLNLLHTYQIKDDTLIRDVLLLHEADEQVLGEVYRGLCRFTIIHFVFGFSDAFLRSLSTNLNCSDPFLNETSVAIVNTWILFRLKE